MNTELELAWLAGIMEGEGTFAIYHQKTGEGRPNGQIRGSVSLTNTDPFLINRCHQIFSNMGITMYMHQYNNKKGSTRTVFDLQTSKHSYVKKICETLLPYLIGEKKPKAEMLLRYVSNRLNKGIKANYDEEDWKTFRDFRSPETTRETEIKDIVRS